MTADDGALAPGAAHTVVPVEARDFQGLRAGIVSRAIANAIDFALLVAALIAVYLGYVGLLFLWNPSSFGGFPRPRFGLVLIMGGLLLGTYFWISWATTGRTYGDHVMGLRVVGLRGTTMRWTGALLRAAFCVALPIGLFWVVVSGQNRSVQDVVLRSSVIYDWEARAYRRRRASSGPGAVQAPRAALRVRRDEAP